MKQQQPLSLKKSLRVLNTSTLMDRYIGNYQFWPERLHLSIAYTRYRKFSNKGALLIRAHLFFKNLKDEFKSFPTVYDHDITCLYSTKYGLSFTMFTVGKHLSSAFQIRSPPCCAQAHGTLIGESLLQGKKTQRPILFYTHHLVQQKVYTINLAEYSLSDCQVRVVRENEVLYGILYILAGSQQVLAGTWKTSSMPFWSSLTEQLVELVARIQGTLY